MGNTLLTPDVIAQETLMELENNLVMGNNVHREYRKEFTGTVGDTVTIRKPVRFTSGSSMDITNSKNDVKQGSTSIVIDKIHNVSWEFSAKELALDIDEYSKLCIQPATGQLANDVDSDLCDLYTDVFNAGGTAGTTPSSFAALGAAGQKLDEFGIPRKDRKMVLNPAAMWSMADALKGLYLQTEVRKMIEDGYLGKVAGFEIFGDQNIYSHTAGGGAGTPIVALDSDIGSLATGLTYLTSDETGETSSLYTEGWTASTAVLTEGDIITFPACYSVNPKSRRSTGSLQQFVVNAAVTADASGYATLNVSPAINTSGAYQTVTAAPVDGAALTLISSHSANLAFHRNAFGLVTVPIPKADGCPWGAQVSHNGLSLTITKGWDVNTNKETVRIDILYGVKTLYRDLACRLFG